MGINKMPLFWFIVARYIHIMYTFYLQYRSANSNTQGTNIFVRIKEVRINQNWGKIGIFGKYKRNASFTI